jgi:tungstate transport system substrate-binding protein
VAGLLVCLTAAACTPAPAGLVLATTSSADDTGLLDTLAATYHAGGGAHRLRPVVVGTGEALALGRRGDADVLLVHAEADELRFMAEGHGALRRTIFANEFVVAGPAADPVGLAGGADAVAAFRRISEAGAPFISRGDGSGTHAAEQALWRAAGLGPVAGANGYVEAGLGMAETLRMASERGAYTLTDAATLTTLRAGLRLRVVVSGDPRLENRYSVIVVRGAREEAGARAFADWLAGVEAGAVIAGFGRARYGAPLFRRVRGDARDDPPAPG